MFQTGFQSNAFQTVRAAAIAVVSGFGWKNPYLDYKNKQSKLQKQQQELKKINDRLETQRLKQAQLEQDKLLANKRAAIRLAELETKYLNEINRLLQMKALLMQRIRQNEEALIVILMMKRKRLRVA